MKRLFTFIALGCVAFTFAQNQLGKQFFIDTKRIFAVTKKP